MPRPTKSKPDATVQDGRNAALRLLAQREHGAAELASKLTQRGFSADLVDEVINELRAHDLQSDARYAEMIVRNRIAQGRGLLRIRNELEQARVSGAAISAALADVEVDWQEQIEAVYACKFTGAPGSAADWQKRYRFLLQRGFAGEAIRKVLGKIPRAR
ncbi:regulatory protein RecX [Sinimarinibacterium sp. NLF-5-8]|uniref:regulatory protein RecX n=1 Tax=Sinimarinibacterium sp. NLF-5-8 TaxID=2698684 RepID=UPI00137BF936|nr:regulatory protein RecX [Sinimarinibacterium sp. NLF-5-8]QHS10098.1 regulatory protein RecX [Sinimarinibacterium sp. NLF-5-8]